MNGSRIAALALLAATASDVFGQQPDAVVTLTRELKARAPAQWQVRVRWRDGALLASITPMPYDTAFQLWYQPQKLHDTLTELCPRSDEEIWTMLKSDQNVILEPTVGGKSGVELRVNCRAPG